MAVRTYIDSCVLIAALRGEQTISDAAMAFLNDPLREYVTSDYVKIELLPKATYHKQDDERIFYEEFFKTSTTHVPSSDGLLALALDEGATTGMSGLDAVHVACALVADAEELITAERTTKPIHRAKGVKVISIRT